VDDLNDTIRAAIKRMFFPPFFVYMSYVDWVIIDVSAFRPEGGRRVRQYVFGGIGTKYIAKQSIGRGEVEVSPASFPPLNLLILLLIYNLTNHLPVGVQLRPKRVPSQGCPGQRTKRLSGPLGPHFPFQCNPTWARTLIIGRIWMDDVCLRRVLREVMSM